MFFFKRFVRSWFLCFLFLFPQLHADANAFPRVLVLIIANDSNPLYVELQKIWRCYMHHDPNHIKAFFIKGDPDLSTECEIRGDEIWSKTAESITPGLLNKTVLSLDTLLPYMEDFDFVLRTNLSSFYVFPRFLEFVSSLPKNRCYCGVPTGDTHKFASGAGFIISPDVVRLIVDHKEELLEALVIDDVLIGELLSKLGIPIEPAPRLDFLNMNDWNHYENRISPNHFHFRVKNENDSLRMESDLYIQKKLLKLFYGVSCF